MLFRVPALTAQDREIVSRIDELKRALSHAVSASPRRWIGSLRRVTFARAVRGSNSIEGYNVEVDDAIAAAEGQEPLEVEGEAWGAVRGYQTAMTYVLQLADDPHFAYSAELLKALHFMMTQHKLDKNPGRWRRGPIFVRDDERDEIVYEGPDAAMVPSLVDELVAYLSAPAKALEVPDLVKAAMAHLDLVMIHPFSDGNGRMARCLQTLVLARTGILAAPFSSIEEYLGRNTRAYYDVLAQVGSGRWHPERDAHPWIRFCLTAHYRQAATLLLRSREIHRLWDALEIEVQSRSLPERTLFALSDAAHGLRVRNATYRPIAEISEAVASRDLKSLVDQGLLVARGEKRGRFYVASERLLAVRIATRETHAIEDPYAEPPGQGGSRPATP
jgi:Fic family protein